MYKEVKTTAIILYVLATVLVSPGCGKKLKKPLVIEPGIGIGEVKFGMSFEEVKKILGKPEWKGRGVATLSYLRLGLTIMSLDGTVDTIKCDKFSQLPNFKPCKFLTKKGIGIGSTEQEIIDLYGEPTDRDDVQPGKDTWLMYKNLGATFRLSDKDGVFQMVFHKPK